jgi:peptidoglycan hydrolase-like protein with peptidoglycan-binding domain
MRWKSALIIVVLAVAPSGMAVADELTQIVQEDLTALGYDTGGTDGTANTKTAIAVSRFQAEHNMEVTGEITPQLAGVIKAAISKGQSAGNVAQPAVATTSQPMAVESEADLRARQQACLQERAAAAEKSASMRRGFGKLLSAVSRSSSQYGSGETASAISTTTGEVNSASATMSDLEGAANDLGLTQSDIDACRNP